MYAWKIGAWKRCVPPADTYGSQAATLIVSEYRLEKRYMSRSRRREIRSESETRDVPTATHVGRKLLATLGPARTEAVVVTYTTTSGKYASHWTVHADFM